jgi:hypothetical protein
MSRSRRNIDRHTSAAQVEANILEHLRKHNITWRDGVPLSTLGYVGFPDYDFRWPQGAALAVSRIVRDMTRRGVLVPGSNGYYPR